MAPNKKVALVTGASSGMGKEIAKQLLQDGLTVVAVARRLEKMTDLQELGAHTIRMDITVEEDVQNAINEINTTFGGVDVLVNNAGFGLYGAIEDLTIDQARYQFDVNIFGLAQVTQLVLPYMREKRAGTIINISSMGGRIYTPLGAWYHASKHALEGWSDCLRIELAPFDINVVVVQPGAIRTAFGDVLTEPMLKASGSGPYAELAQTVAKATSESYESGGGSDPAVITNIVSKAVKARRPKTRYAAGQYAHSMMFMRKWFSDRLFDRILIMAMNR